MRTIVSPTFAKDALRYVAARSSTRSWALASSMFENTHRPPMVISMIVVSRWPRTSSDSGPAKAQATMATSDEEIRTYAVAVRASRSRLSGSSSW